MKFLFLPFLSYLKTLYFYFYGIRIHPSAKFISTSFKNIIFDQGVSVGKDAVFFLYDAGRLLFSNNVKISRAVNFEAVGDITIYSDTTIHKNSTINGKVTIGSNCLISPNVFISSGSHSYQKIPYLTIREQDALIPYIQKNILIENDCWIGVNAVLMPGITIGRGSVIAANSVVRNSVAPYSVVSGNPAINLKARLTLLPNSYVNFNKKIDQQYLLLGDLVIYRNKYCLAVRNYFPVKVKVNNLNSQLNFEICYYSIADSTALINELKVNLYSGFNKVSIACSQNFIHQDIVEISLDSAPKKNGIFMIFSMGFC
ncbi:acyltransferase [Polynucleobacter paneuropaeus]|nr:acyltransferase [Polynucleobacter paneuropaeus]